MQVSSKQNSIVIAIMLSSAVWMGITLSRTLTDVLFLSTYSSALLPYFFFGQTLLILLFTLVISPLAAKGSGRINFAVFSCAAFSVLLGQGLLAFDIPYFTFAFSLWLSAMPILLLVSSQNMIGDAFDVRRFKRLMLWINVAGNLGGMFTGLLLIPLLSHWFGSSGLIYLLALSIFFAGGSGLYLHPVAAMPRRPNQGQSPYNYPLFQAIALCTFLLMLLDTFVDYTLKAELSRTYSDEAEIAQFMGPFYAVSNVLMLLVQLAGTQFLLKLFGVVGLLATVPLFTGVNSLILFALPALWTAVVLRMGEMVLRFSLFTIGREIAMKPLPAQIRRAGKFHIAAMGYLGVGLASVLLLFFVEKLALGLTAVAVLILLTSLIWLGLIRRVHKLYQDTLEEAIRIKRFNLGDDNTFSQQQDNVLDISQYAFQKQDPDAVRFGFTMLERLHAERVPAIALSHINSPHADIRAGLVRVAYQLNDKGTVPLLLKRLHVEEDDKVLWWLLKTLLKLAPEKALDEAEPLLDSPRALARAGAVVILLTQGTLEQLIRAANTLQEMVKHPDPGMRRGAAYAISGLKMGKLHDELHRLLEDPVEAVSQAAIWAVADRQNTLFIPALITRLGHGRASHYASRTLFELGEPSVPHLLKLIESPPDLASVRVGVRVLVRIRCASADAAIVQAAHNADVLTRSLLAKECAMRAKKQANSHYLAQHARTFVFQEARAVRLLKDASLAKSLPGHVRNELRHRRKMAEARLLYWFDVCTQSIELLGVIPAMLSEQRSQSVALKHATALEFLENLTNDNELKQAIGGFEHIGDKAAAENAAAALPSLKDTWLNRVLSIEPALRQQGATMNISEKVMLLRKVKLFSSLPGEILLTIAETCEAREIIKGERIFAQGDFPDGMYIVATGTVGIKKGDTLLIELKEYGFFGELGLFDEAPRMADAVATSDGMLLFLQKEVFDGITEDLPDVLRALVRTVIGYLDKK